MINLDDLRKYPTGRKITHFSWAKDQYLEVTRVEDSSCRSIPITFVHGDLYKNGQLVMTHFYQVWEADGFWDDWRGPQPEQQELKLEETKSQENEKSRRERLGLCPVCGSKGEIINWAMTCKDHGPYGAQ